jgi:hypothetical protein
MPPKSFFAEKRNKKVLLIFAKKQPSVSKGLRKTRKIVKRENTTMVGK